MTIVFVDEATFMEARRALKDDSVEAVAAFYEAFVAAGRYALDEKYIQQ